MQDRPHLAPTPYHCEVRDYLRERERELWSWFSTAQAREAYANELKLSLLKSTYRLTPADHPELYAQLEEVKQALGIAVPVTLYQAQSGNTQANAALFHLPEEAHVVLSGPLLSLLNPVETKAVFGHELAHRLFWTAEGGDFFVADRILEAAARDPRARSVHLETARRYRLHTEIFADRGALHAAGDLSQTVAALVKISTGLSASRGETYLAQAAEIFAQAKVKTDALSHPEMFLRAHALSLFAEGNETLDTSLQTMIRGELTADNLDLSDQQRVTSLTRRFLAQLLRPSGFRSEAALAQARHYFADFQPSETEDPGLCAALIAEGELVPTYFAYVLLDFVRVDPDLEQLPLAAAFQWAEDLGIAAPFEKLLSKELGIKAKELARLKPKAAEMLRSPSPGHGPSA